MERKKPIDELAIAKSAAWAWYQRGTGSEARPIREVISRKNLGAPKPTRYKLEAMKKQSPIPSSELPANSLLDAYEIERISRELDLYIKSASGGGGGYHGGGRRTIGTESETSGVKSKKQSKKTNGFWRTGDRLVCGSIDDVVVAESGGFVGRRRPENQVPVVQGGSCRPRRNCASIWP